MVKTLIILCIWVLLATVFYAVFFRVVPGLIRSFRKARRETAALEQESNEDMITKCGCGDQYATGIEYEWSHSQHYDGISEWQCSKCNRRWGRWSGKELTGAEYERKYGK